MKRKVHREFKMYEDMLHLPHHETQRRGKMPIGDRAAQFSPFSAVVGYDDAVKEAARHRVQKKELDEMEKAYIDVKLRDIMATLPDTIEVEIVYFEPDGTKTGGCYRTKIGRVKKIDKYEKAILMTDGSRIAIEAIYQIDKK